jgi:hypothetical protein
MWQFLLGGLVGWGVGRFAKMPKGGLTPARAALHGELMTKEHNPQKLARAANLFGQAGLVPQAQALASKAQQVAQQAAVGAELAERARAGDQNAMGMITAIRDQAEKGSARARVSCILIEEYCRANPPKEEGPAISAEQAEADRAAEIPLAEMSPPNLG